MEFIKKNYEKIILSLVLLGLVGVLAFMPVMIISDQQRMRDLRDTVRHPKAVPLADLDLSRQTNVMDRLQSPEDLDFSTTNKLFNPVQWVKNKDGTLMKITTGHEIGPGAAVIARITPLYFTIALDSVITNEPGARYVFSIEDQTAPIPAQRHKRPHYASKGETVSDKMVGGKNEGFTLKDVKGAPENPDQLVLLLAGTQTPRDLVEGQSVPARGCLFGGFEI